MVVLMKKLTLLYFSFQVKITLIMKNINFPLAIKMMPWKFQITWDILIIILFSNQCAEIRPKDATWVVIRISC